jgi:hypothetical protein
MAWASAVELTRVAVTREGVSADYTLVAPTATHGNKFHNSGREFLKIVNGSAAPITVTLTPGTSVDGLALPTKVYTIAATGSGTGVDDQVIGPFPATWNYSEDWIWVICSAVVTVTIGVFSMP